jgi:hypothetical protein
LQLVIFIRSIAYDQVKNEELSSALYEAFEEPQILVQKARSNEYQVIGNLEKKYNILRAKRLATYAQVENGKGSLKDAAELYREELHTLEQLNKHKEVDQLFGELIDTLKSEIKLFQTYGLGLLNKKLYGPVLNGFMNILSLYKGIYRLKDDKLTLNLRSEMEQKIAKAGNDSVKELNEMIADLEKNKKVEEGKLSSAEKAKNVDQLTAEIKSDTKLRDDTLSFLVQAALLRQKQLEIYNALQEKLKAKETQKGVTGAEPKGATGNAQKS